MSDRCFECKNKTGYYCVHEGEQYCFDCYGKHTPEVKIEIVRGKVTCPFCQREMFFKAGEIPEECRCEAKITNFSTPKDKLRFIKWK